MNAHLNIHGEMWNSLQTLASEEIAPLKPYAFISWMKAVRNEIEEKLLSPLSSLQIQPLVNKVLKKTVSKVETQMPVFSTLGKRNPDYHFENISQKNNYSCTEGVYHDSKSSTHSWIPSPEEVKELFEELKKQECISWEFSSDGCFARCHMTCQWLLASGVEMSHVFKQYINGKFVYKSPNNKENIWTYHVAAALKDKNGQVWVFDLSFEPNRPLKLEEWQKCLENIAQKGSIKPTLLSSSLLKSPILNEVEYMDVPEKQSEYFLNVLWNFKLYETVQNFPALKSSVERYCPLMESCFVNKDNDEIKRFKRITEKLHLFNKGSHPLIPVTPNEIKKIDVKLVKDSYASTELIEELQLYKKKTEDLNFDSEDRKVLTSRINDKISELSSLQFDTKAIERKKVQDRIDWLSEALKSDPDNEELQIQLSVYQRKLQQLKIT